MAESGDTKGRSWELNYQRIMSQAVAFLVSRGLTRDAAEEAAHEFFSSIVIQRGLGERLMAAGAHDGALLHKALRDFHVERLRRAIIERRRLRSLGERHTPSSGPSYGGSDRALAVAIVQEAIRRTENHYRERQMEKHWSAFETRILLPILRGTTAPSVKELATRMGLKRGNDLSSILQQVRLRFTANLMAIMGVEASSMHEVTRHVESLFSLLSNDHTRET